jgi:hypothetical protein
MIFFLMIFWSVRKFPQVKSWLFQEKKETFAFKLLKVKHCAKPTSQK